VGEVSSPSRESVVGGWCVFPWERENTPPGQYKDPKHHAGARWQIRYTRRMKSRTEYVRRECVTGLRRQILTHKRFKRLVDQWIDLSIERSSLRSREKTPGTRLCGWDRPVCAVMLAQRGMAANKGDSSQ